jgi:hypothetical protein
MPPAQTHQKSAPRPIPSGWALDQILLLDEAHAGFLRFLHGASALRRQGVYLALTQLDYARPDILASAFLAATTGSQRDRTSALAVTATSLMTMRVSDVIHCVFGFTPNGLRGALARCGPDPLDKVTYTRLRAIHDDVKNRPRAALLRHAGQIDDDLVGVVALLPGALLHAEVLRHIRCPEHLEHYAGALKLIHRLHPTTTDQLLNRSFCQMSGGSNLTAWIHRWIEAADDLPPALPCLGDDVLRPIVSGPQMKELARRYQNCLRGRICAVALGRVCYYEHLGNGSPGALAEVVALSDGQWLLQGIYAEKNGRATPTTIRSIRAKFAAAGVLVAAADIETPETAALADMLGVFMFAGGASTRCDPSLADWEGDTAGVPGAAEACDAH